MSRQAITVKRTKLLKDLKKISTEIPQVEKVISRIEEYKNLYIAYSLDEIGKVSFAPSEEFKYDHGKRHKTTIGRVIRRRLEKYPGEFVISDQELIKIQDLMLKNLGITIECKEKYDVLVGEDIANVYAEGKIGTNSCAIGEKNRKYTELYVNNQERIALIIFESDGEKKRALRWLTDSGIYVYDYSYSTTWKVNGKLEQIAKATNGKTYADCGNQCVTLKKPEKYLPLLDTFIRVKFVKDGIILTNDPYAVGFIRTQREITIQKLERDYIDQYGEII